jgi:uncharacterized protein YraI
MMPSPNNARATHVKETQAMNIRTFTLSILAALPLAASVLVADAPKAEAASCVVNVESWDRLNVRTGPGASYSKKFSLRPGQCGIRVYRDCEGNWCPINFRGRHGWVNTRYIGSEAEGGDDSIGRQRRFDKPRYDGIRLDARRFYHSGFDMPGTAHRFCRNNGYGAMVDYRVQTASRTIAMGDGNIFRNGPSSNTSYRYIICE